MENNSSNNKDKNQENQKELEPKYFNIKEEYRQSNPTEKAKKGKDKTKEEHFSSFLPQESTEKLRIIKESEDNETDKLKINDNLQEMKSLGLNDQLSLNRNDSLSLGRFDSAISINTAFNHSNPKGNYKSLSLEKGSTIPKYPYNGKRDKLIDKIFFIGYEKNNLRKLIERKKQELKTKEKEKSRDDSFQDNLNKKAKKRNDSEEMILLDEKPVVLSEISSNYDTQCIDNDTIVDLIFPVHPTIFNIDFQQDIKGEDLKNQDSNIVFSFNIPLEGNSKTSNNFYAYIYYELFHYINTFMIPYAICFLSEYPYFLNYKSIANEIRNYFITSIPKEFIVYNLVNFIPAPINSSITVKLYPDQMSKNKHYFKQLSGYPLLQFDLTELFNILPTEIIIQMFFFTFLENDMMIFSENLEILNIVMYIFANLNYPLNDSTYFFHILSVSKETFMNGTSAFVTKTFSSMLGINCSYHSKLNTTSKKQEHFIVDLEKKEFSYHYNEARLEIVEDVKINIDLLDYVRESLKGLHNTEFLGKSIYELYESLDSISKKVTHTNLVNTLADPNFFKSTEEKDLAIIEKQNKQIQEHFYVFILKILLKFFPFYKIEIPRSNDEQFTIDYQEKFMPTTKPIEEHFFKKFKDCSKFNTYISNFIQNNDSIDLFKIPLLFAEEFINQMICNHQQHKPVSLVKTFDTIDLFYDVSKMYFVISFDFDAFYKAVSIKNNPQILEDQNILELVNYSKVYQENKKKSNPEKLKEIHHKEFFKYALFIKSLSSPETQSKINALFPCLAKKMTSIENNEKEKNTSKIDDGINYLKKQKDQANDSGENISETKNRISKSKYDKDVDFEFKAVMNKIRKSKKENLKVNEITKETPSLIQELVEKNILQQKQLSRNELIFNSFLLLFAITRKAEMEETNDNLDFIIDLLKCKKNLYSFRKFANIFVILYYKIIEQKKGENADKEKKALTRMIALIKEANLIPNEELLLYLNNSINKQYVDVDELSQIIANAKYKPFTPFIKRESNENSFLQDETVSVKPIEDSSSNSSSKKNVGALSHQSSSSSKENNMKNFLQYNLSSDGKRRYADYFITLSENILYEGDLTVNNDIISPRLRSSMSTRSQSTSSTTTNPIEPQSNNQTTWVVPVSQQYFCYTFIFSALKLYNCCVNMLNVAIRAENAFESDFEKLKNIACNLIFYIENIPDLLNLSFGKKEGCKEHDQVLGTIETIRNSMLEFLYSILNNLPKDKLEIKKYQNQSASKEIKK